MSVDEDTELQDLLTQTLEANGCFAKIRAQLRASIYLALDEDETLQKKETMLNRKLKASLETEEGRIMFCIVREFLEYFGLNFTLSVYEPESYIGSHYQYKDREQIIRDLNMPNSDFNSPVLLQIINFCKSRKNNSSTFDQRRVSLDNKQENYLDSEKSSVQDNSNANEINGNKTFDVNSPMFQKENDASEGTTSNENPETKSSSFNITLDVDKTTDQNIASDLEISPPIVKDSKYSKFDSTKEKLKLSAQKMEKVKPRNNLNSLSDLPPISVNKSRSNEMLLPPLYMKEFKEMNSQKELEKMFDLEALDNYEEDFMSESEIDLVLNKGDVQESPKVSLVDDRVKKSVNTMRGVEVDVGNKNNDQNSSVSSVTSNDFEFNSNIDDILTSC